MKSEKLSFASQQVVVQWGEERAIHFDRERWPDRWEKTRPDFLKSGLSFLSFNTG